MSVPLQQLQRWMQSVVVHPGPVEQAVADAAVRRELPAGGLGDVILPSAHLDPVQRLGIYHAMYPLRMEEALAADYPALKHFLGEQEFFALAQGYAQAFPSRSFTLNPFGRRLPDYLQATASGAGNGRAAGVRRRAFCHDLARLELAIVEAFDAPETPALDEDAIAGVPADAWEGARLVPVAAFRLLSLRYPAGAYLDSLHDPAHAHPPLRRQDSWIVVYRRSYAVYRHDLGRAAHDVLADLAAGRTVGEAVGAALKRRGTARPQADDLFRWFRQWAAAGLFTRVERA
jgi:hypothetical protein